MLLWRVPLYNPETPNFCYVWHKEGWLSSHDGRSLKGSSLSCKHWKRRQRWIFFAYTVSILTQTRGRLCYFSEPDTWKALPFPWIQLTGVLDMTMVLSTIHIHSRLLLPTPTPIPPFLIPISCHYFFLLYTLTSCFSLLSPSPSPLSHSFPSFFKW